MNTWYQRLTALKSLPFLSFLRTFRLWIGLAVLLLIYMIRWIPADVKVFFVPPLLLAVIGLSVMFVRSLLYPRTIDKDLDDHSLVVTEWPKIPAGYRIMFGIFICSILFLAGSLIVSALIIGGGGGFKGTSSAIEQTSPKATP